MLYRIAIFSKYRDTLIYRYVSHNTKYVNGISTKLLYIQVATLLIQLLKLKTNSQVNLKINVIRVVTRQMIAILCTG